MIYDVRRVVFVGLIVVGLLPLLTTATLVYGLYRAARRLGRLCWSRIRQTTRPSSTRRFSTSNAPLRSRWTTANPWFQLFKGA